MDEAPKKTHQPSADEKSGRVAPNLKLRRERELKGWSQAMLAEQIGAQPKLVTRWETGAAFPSPYYRQQLCQLFEKNAEDLGLLRQTQKAILEANIFSERFSQAQETILDASISSEPFANEQGQQTVAPPTQQAVEPSASRHVSRRVFVFGGIGSAVIVLSAGGFWWANALGRHGQSAVVASDRSKVVMSYIYHAPDTMSLNDAAWSPLGDTIACATGDKTVRIIKAATGQ